MTDQKPGKVEVDQFILDEIDGVPHLEALLLLRNSQPKEWSLEEMARALYVSLDAARRILEELIQKRVISGSGSAERYHYEPAGEEREKLLDAVDGTYRREVVRLSTMIHSKASPGVREFARAFRFTKDRE
jgi:hypothetical protein